MSILLDNEALSELAGGVCWLVALHDYQFCLSLVPAPLSSSPSPSQLVPAPHSGPGQPSSISGNTRITIQHQAGPDTLTGPHPHTSQDFNNQEQHDYNTSLGVSSDGSMITR